MLRFAQDDRQTMDRLLDGFFLAVAQPSPVMLSPAQPCHAERSPVMLSAAKHLSPHSLPSQEGYPVMPLFQRALSVFKATFLVALKRNKNEKNLKSVSYTIQRIVYYPEKDLFSPPDLQEHQGSKLESSQSYG